MQKLKARAKIAAIIAVGASLAALSLPLIASDQQAPASDQPNAAAAEAANVEIGQHFIDIEAMVAFDSATLRIAGPNGYALTRRHTSEDGNYITADLILDAEDARRGAEHLSAWSNLPDGRYYFEVDFHGAAGSIKRHSGSFVVEDGAAVQLGDEPLSFEAPEQPEAGMLQRVAGTLLDILVPSAHAQSGDFDNFVSIRNTTPGAGQSRLNLNATDSITVNADAWRVFNNAAQGHRFEIVEGTGTDSRLVILQGGNTGIGTASPQDQLHVVDSSGFQVRLDSGSITTRLDTFGSRFAIYGANSAQFQLNHDAPTGSMVIDASGGVTTAADIVAGGNVTSTERLFINSSSSIGFVDYTTTGAQFLAGVGTSGDWGVCDNSGSCFFALRVNQGAPNNSLTIGATGDIGVGTNTPDTALHVNRSNNTAHIRVQDSGTSSPQVLFSLIKAGYPQFQLQNTAQTDFNWTFRLAGNSGVNERFEITKVGTGAAEFELFADGSANFRGDVTANGVLLTSTREAKTDFRELNEQDILDKLSSLEISQWRYKHEDEETVHIGPVAEEFHEVFGLSDGKRLNMIDTNGITFAAIQALNSENRELKQRLAALEQKLLD